MNIVNFIFGLKVGGAESFIKNVMESFKNDSNYKFSFIVQDGNIENDYFKSNENVRIMKVPSFPKNILRHYLDLKKLLSSEKIDVLHIHMNSFINPIPIILCIKLKIPFIVHSHNTRNASGGFLGRLVHYFNRKIFKNKIPLRVACGNDAGKWMFHKENFIIVSNSIKVEKFIFNSDARKDIRNNLGIESKTIVIGIVGRLHAQKNHKKAIEIFKKFHQHHQNSILLIVGEGTQRKKIEQYITDEELGGSVMMLGSIQDTSPYYSAMDILLMPSLYEGLTIVGIEAQASGLPIIASTKVSNETNISNSMVFLNNKDSDAKWVETMEQEYNSWSEEKRIFFGKKVQESQYSSDNLYKSLTSLYLTLK